MRIGVIGTGGRRRRLMQALKRVAGDEIQLVAFCDVHARRRSGYRESGAHQAAMAFEQFCVGRAAILIKLALQKAG